MAIARGLYVPHKSNCPFLFKFPAQLEDTSSCDSWCFDQLPAAWPLTCYYWNFYILEEICAELIKYILRYPLLSFYNYNTTYLYNCFDCIP